jgi:hypothetical protein
MGTKDKVPIVREAVGIFFDSKHLHDAVDELASSGFNFDDIGLLAGQYTVKQRLGEFYNVVNESADTSEGPSTAFVAEKSMGDTVHAFLGTLFFAGTTAASGAVVASAAVLGGSLLPAVAGAVALGAIGGALSLIIRQSDAEHIEEQVDEGHLLLFVRTEDADEETKAVDILSRHGAFEARVCEAPAATT